MKEDFLHYLWKYKKFNLHHLKTSTGEEVVIKNVGEHNTTRSGPDFFNARLCIDNQQWAGNVELHLKSSDWYAHHHEQDPNYDNVILHVVWKDDFPVFRKDNTQLPTLELKEYVSKELLQHYKRMFATTTSQWISCEKQLASGISDFIFFQWKQRLFIERLQYKSELVLQFLALSKNDWEAVLFKMLCKNFGLTVNSEAFLSLANTIDFKIIKKERNNLQNLEALFLGQGGLLKEDTQEPYTEHLLRIYQFLKHKYHLDNSLVFPFHFHRLRPANFPTIRLAQLAALYHQHQGLLSKLINCDTIEELYEVFAVNTSEFWNTHYVLDKTSSFKTKTMSHSFVDLILINTIFPIKFIYSKMVLYQDEDRIDELMVQLKPEKNSILTKFQELNVVVKNALDSQALIHLKNNYCDQKACLKCAIGNYFLNKG